MIDHLKVFLLSETNTSNFLEYAGNILLLPTRYVWNGHSIKIGHVKDTPSLEMHCQTETKTDEIAIKLLSIIGMIVAIVPGILFKGLAYLCSSSTRARHAVIIESRNPFPPLPQGVTWIDCNKNVIDPQAQQVDLTLVGGLKFDCADHSEVDLETFIGKKVLEMKSYLSLVKVVTRVDIGNREFNTLDHTKKIKVGSEEVTLDYILFSRHIRNTVFGRCADPQQNAYGCVIGNDWYIGK